MPSFKTKTIIELARDVHLSFRVEAGLTGLGAFINRLVSSRSGKPSIPPAPSQAPASLGQRAASERFQSPHRGQAEQTTQGPREELGQARQQPASKAYELKCQGQEPEWVRQQVGSKSRELEKYRLLSEDFYRKALEMGYGDLSKYYWYHTIDVGNGLVTPGIHDHRPNLPAFKFPVNMEGMNVLDVGSATGFFAFEFEKRGANVTSVELPAGTPADRFPGETTQQSRRKLEELYRRFEHQTPSQSANSIEQRPDLLQTVTSETDTPEELPRSHNDAPFEFCHKVLNSKVQRRYSSIYDLSKENLGRDDFDLVFLGDILIHTINPLKALAAVAPLCRGTLIISQELPEGPYPAMVYIGGDKAGEDASAWWKPNRLCFEQMLKKLGFKEVTVVGEHTGFMRPAMAPYKRGILHATK